jgi:transposase
MDVIVERCAFLGVHRDTVMACARTPDGHGGRREEVSEFGSTTSQLLALVDWLAERRVTLVGMEATGVYWKPVVRHEALCDREGVKGPLLWAVAAAC